MDPLFSLQNNFSAHLDMVVGNTHSDVHSRMLKTDQLEDHLQTSRQVSDSFTLTSTRDLLASNVWCWTWRCKFSGLKWFAILVRPQAHAEALKVNKMNINLSWNCIGKEGADLVFGSLWLHVLENHVMEMESSCTQ